MARAASIKECGGSTPPSAGQGCAQKGGWGGRVVAQADGKAPDAVVRLRDLGLLRPEEFCPNKAGKSLEYLAKQEAERSEKGEVRCHLLV